MSLATRQIRRLRRPTVAHRPNLGRAGAGVLALVLLGAVALGGCDSDRRAIDRSDLPAFDPTPVAVFVLTDEGVHNDDGVDPTIAAGETFAVRNEGTVAHRLQGETIDTGDLLPGEQTLVVIDTVGDHDFVVPDTGATLVVTIVAASDPA